MILSLLCILNLCLTLFVFFVISSLYFPRKFADKFYEFFSNRNIPVIVVTVISYVVLLFSLQKTETLWKEKYWVPVEAVVTNSEAVVIEHNYGPDEHGFSDIEYFTEYQISYEFEYMDETYHISQKQKQDRSIGTVETIRIKPHRPETKTPLMVLIPYLVLCFGGCLLLLYFILALFIK